MKKLTLLILTVVVCLTTFAQAQNLLSGKFSKDELSKILIAPDKWVPFPKIDDRAGWAKADQEMMKAYVKTAETYLNYEWPGIPATKSLLIERTGDRDEYQTISFKKREVLGTLLLGRNCRKQRSFHRSDHQRSVVDLRRIVLGSTCPSAKNQRTFGSDGR